MRQTVDHPMTKPTCSSSLEPGSIGGSKDFPLVKRIPLIVIETGKWRAFYTDEGLCLGVFGENAARVKE